MYTLLVALSWMNMMGRYLCYFLLFLFMGLTES